MAPDILFEFSPSDLSIFSKDFIQMIKVGSEIDRYYGEAQHDLDSLIIKFGKLSELFNRKYKGVKIKTKKNIDDFRVRVFIKEKNIKEFFAQTAAKIPGLKSVGRTDFNQVDVNEVDKFSRFLEVLSDKIYISYSDQETGTSTIAAALDRNEKKIEIIYNSSEMTNDNSAGFKICAFYALKGGFDKKIEIYGEASTFGFLNLMDEQEKREWFDKFNPRFLE